MLLIGAFTSQAELDRYRRAVCPLRMMLVVKKKLIDDEKEKRLDRLSL